jgi:hypothetical protein
MRSSIGLFEKTCICRGGQSREELNLRTVIDECFFVERVSKNLEEIGNLQRMLSENFAVSCIERSSQMVRLRSGCNQDVCVGPMVTRLWEYRISEKTSQLIEFRHLKMRIRVLLLARCGRRGRSGNQLCRFRLKVIKLEGIRRLPDAFRTPSLPVPRVRFVSVEAP